MVLAKSGVITLCTPWVKNFVQIALLYTVSEKIKFFTFIIKKNCNVYLTINKSAFFIGSLPKVKDFQTST